MATSCLQADQQYRQVRHHRQVGHPVQPRNLGRPLRGEEGERGVQTPSGRRPPLRADHLAAEQGHDGHQGGQGGPETDVSSQASHYKGYNLPSVCCEGNIDIYITGHTSTLAEVMLSEHPKLTVCEHSVSRVFTHPKLTVCEHSVCRVFTHPKLTVCGHLLSRVFTHPMLRVCEHLLLRVCQVCRCVRCVR